MLSTVFRRCAGLARPVACALAGCSSESTPELPPDTGPSAITFDLRTPVDPQAEAYLCELVKMPDAAGEIFVSGGSYTTTPGTHHFLLFRTSDVDPSIPLGTPIDCFEGQGVMRFERGFVTGGQSRADNADFPDGVALAFAPGEVLLFQAHVLNPGASKLDASVHVEMKQVDASKVAQRVGTFRFYDPFIFVPAHGKSTARMRCPVQKDVTLVSAGSHMHRRGVAYRAFLDLPNGRADAPFFTTNDWQNPVYYHGPLTAPAGAHVRFECDYDSQDPTDVVQGLSADANEMCMFSAFYYPQLGADDDACVAMDEHGSGGRSCAQTLSCIQTCPRSDAPVFGDGKADVGPCFQKCIVDSCANATGALFPELSCAQHNCADACASYGPACTSCVMTKCARELDACQALACDANESKK